MNNFYYKLVKKNTRKENSFLSTQKNLFVLVFHKVSIPRIEAMKRRLGVNFFIKPVDL